MRFASNNLERVKEAIKVNGLLESKPTEIHNFKTPEQLMDLRPLNKDKILDPFNPNFKFKAGNSIERILETIQASRNYNF